MRAALLLLLLIPAVSASHTDSPDAPWREDQAGILSVVIGGCPQALREDIYDEVEDLNRLFVQEHMAVRIETPPARTLQTDHVAEALRTHDLAPIEAEIARQQADVVVACQPGSAFPEGILGVTLSKVVHAPTRLAGALVALPQDGTGTPAGCDEPAPFTATTMSNLVRHELLHSLGLRWHPADTADVLHEGAQFEPGRCDVAHERRLDPQPPTLDRLRALWPATSAAIDNVARFDAEHGLATVDAAGGPLSFVGLSHFESWVVVGAAAVFLVSATLIVLTRRS